MLCKNDNTNALKKEELINLQHKCMNPQNKERPLFQEVLSSISIL
jgi:hypothetical protein